jgi:hypothetical protein
MRTLLLAALLSVAPAAHAAYFHVLQPLDEVKSGVFIKVGAADNLAYGFQTTVIKHRAEDGALLIPGVSWSLLDVGAAKTDTGSLSAVLGPSIDLSEPVKAVLLSGVKAAWPTSMGALKSLLAPAQDGKACVALSLGPGLAVERAERLFYDPMGMGGAFVLHAGLSAKW